MKKKRWVMMFGLCLCWVSFACEEGSSDDSETDSKDSETGFCFYECGDDEYESSSYPSTEADCNAEAENDSSCSVLSNVHFAKGCDECEQCAPDWFECF